MRPRSRAAFAASRAARGAGADGWPTSMWITLSPRRSLAAAALSTSMARNEATRSMRRAMRGWRRAAGVLVMERVVAGCWRGLKTVDGTGLSFRGAEGEPGMTEQTAIQ